MKKEPDFYFITGEFNDSIIYSCWILKKITPKNPNASAILIRIEPPHKHEKANKVTEVILATTPKNALYPQPKFPEWVTMYKPLKPILIDKPLEKDEIAVIDKGEIFKNISDIPEN